VKLDHRITSCQLSDFRYFDTGGQNPLFCRAGLIFFNFLGFSPAIAFAKKFTAEFPVSDTFTVLYACFG